MQLKLISLSFIFFLVSTITIFAQNTKIDSLLRLLNKAQADTSRVIFFNQLSFEYNFSDNKKALDFGEKALALAKKMQYHKGEAYAHVNIGVTYANVSEYDNALEHYKIAIKIFKKIKYKLGESTTLNNIGVVYDFKGDYDKALQYYMEALDISEKLQDKQNISMCLSNIGTIFYLKGDYTKALAYYEKCLQIDRTLPDKNAIVNSLNNIAMIFTIQKDYDKALRYHFEALKITEITQNKQSEIANLVNIARIYTDQNKIPDALQFLQKAVEYCKQLQDTFRLINVYEALIKIYRTTKEYEKAITLAFECLHLAKAQRAKLEISNAYENLAYLYQKIDDYRKAFEYKELHIQYKDSIFSEKSQQNIQTIELKRKETENKLLLQEKKLQMLQGNRQKRFIGKQYVIASLLVFLIFVLAGFIFALLKVNQLKQRNQQLLEQQMHNLQEAKQEVEALNRDLENKVENRTQHLQDANDKLRNHAFFNSHILRRPVANILGLISIFNHDNIADEFNLIVLEKLLVSTKELDAVIQQINEILEEEI